MAHSQSWPVQREPGQSASVWHLPGAPGSPCTQQISPSSHAPGAPPMQAQYCDVQGACPHAAALAQMNPL
jgi:hypothetical protein